MLKRAAFFNSDGNGFNPARSCPGAVTMSGTVGGITETVTTAAKVRGGRLVCEGVSAAGISLRLEYSSDYSTFLTGTYVNSLNVNPTAGSGAGTLLGATFSDPEAKFVSFALPSNFSNYDGGLDSDNYDVGSTGSVSYPDGYADNDADARLYPTGLVRNDSGWNLAYWSNPKTSTAIDRNPNNSGSVFFRPSQTSTGFLFFDIDRPFALRLVEFDSAAFKDSGELRRLSVLETSSSSGTIGYLQKNLSFSGTRSSGDSAMPFDFKNRNFAVFVSYPPAYSGSVTHLKYRIAGETEGGTGMYLVPIDDSVSGVLKYFGSDIVIDSSGNYRYKFLES